MRGMTLVEVLLALTLLGALMLASVSWIQGAARLTTDVSDRARWEAAADRLLQSIQDDLLIGDFAIVAKDPRQGGNEPRKPEPRAKVEGDKLRISTRRSLFPAGPLAREYEFRSAQRAIFSLDGTGRPRPASEEGVLVLGEVARFECALDEEKNQLTARVVSTSGVSRSRRVRLE